MNRKGIAWVLWSGPLERTGPAGSFPVVVSGACAGPAAQRPHVILPMRVSLLIVFVIYAAGMFGCSKPAAPQLVSSLPKYHGQTREAVESTLGTPTRTDKYPMSQAVGEMRVPLFNTYPASNPANANVMIEESWWKDGDYWITLWFHEVNGQWVVLDSCRWQKDVQF